MELDIEDICEDPREYKEYLVKVKTFDSLFLVTYLLPVGIQHSGGVRCS